MTPLLAALLLLAALSSPAQASGGSYHHWVDSIGSSRTASTLDLVRRDTALNGYLYLAPERRSVLVAGSIDTAGQFRLEGRNALWDAMGTLAGRISGQRLSARWDPASAPHRVTTLLDLVETYTTAVRFEPYFLDDSVLLLPERHDTEAPSAEVTLRYLHPIAVPRRGTRRDALARLQKGLMSEFRGPTALARDPQRALRAERGRWFQEYLSMRDEYDSTLGDQPYRWAEVSEADIVMNTLGILSIEFHGWNYTGGAHGVGGSTYAVFNTTTGARIRRSDLVLPARERDLAALLEQKVLAAMSARRDEPSSREDLLADKVPVTDNFYLTPGGIGFVYNVYEVASYADGIFDIFLPWAEIQPYLRPGTIASEFMRPNAR